LQVVGQGEGGGETGLWYWLEGRRAAALSPVVLPRLLPAATPDDDPGSAAARIVVEPTMQNLP